MKQKLNQIANSICLNGAKNSTYYLWFIGQVGNLAAVCSKAVNLLLFILCLLLLQLCVGTLFCVVVLGGLSGFCNNIAEEERAGCSTLIVLWVLCSLSHPHGAVGWSAICDCD